MSPLFSAWTVLFLLFTIADLEGTLVACYGFSTRLSNLPDIKAAVIVPGFLTGAEDFRPLAENLTSRGIPTVVVPMPVWHWLPCLGGRSMRPMLERIEFTVRHLAASGGDPLAIPVGFNYGLMDCWADFRTNPGGVYEVGGSAEVDDYPVVQPRGAPFLPEPSTGPKGRIALIGHSAGGWISRVFLSRRPYGGKAYHGQDLVHTLVTLGTPHGNAPGPAFRGVEWCNRESLPRSVKGLAVAGTGFLGDRSGRLTQNAYAFCCPQGSDGSEYDGDGLTPVDSALSITGEGLTETLVLNGKVTHFPWSDVWGGDILAPDLAKDHREGGTPWYGSNEAIDQWVGFLDS